MRYLFDTQLLIWSVREPQRLSQRIATMIDDTELERYFSVVSIWEIVVKTALKKPNFDFDSEKMRKMLLAGALQEIEITSAHAFAVGELPLIHRDPFDRMLIAQAIAEGLTLVTADKTLVRYPAKVLVM